jgi:hypothetical protein
MFLHRIAYGKLKSTSSVACVVALDVLMVACTITMVAVAIAITDRNKSSSAELTAVWASATFPFCGLMLWWPLVYGTTLFTQPELVAAGASFAVSIVWWAQMIYYYKFKFKPRWYDDDQVTFIMCVWLFLWFIFVQTYTGFQMKHDYAECMLEIYERPGPCWTSTAFKQNSCNGCEFRLNPACGKDGGTIAASHAFGWLGGFGTIRPLYEYAVRYKDKCKQSKVYNPMPYYIDAFWATFWIIFYTQYCVRWLRKCKPYVEGIKQQVVNDNEQGEAPRHTRGTAV